MRAEDVLTTTFDIGHDEMVLVRDIELWSMCEHHLVPFTGVAHVGYIPNEDGKITGLSKIARLVDVYAKRPQVQERLTTQVADSMMRLLEPRGVIVVYRVRAPVHDDAGRAQAGIEDRDQRGSRPAARSCDPGRGHEPHPRFVTRDTGAVTDRSGRPAAYVSGLPTPDRCLVMGVVNVTPDSFSDGGMWFEPEDAVGHGLEMRAAGADLLDVGGESTRPGAERPPLDEELHRVLPVVAGLVAAGAAVSIDTMRAEVAVRAVEVGACLVNDVSGGLADPDMLPAVADLGVAYNAMHWRGHSSTMQDWATYEDVLCDVRRELDARVEAALGAGIARDRLSIDPGLGFAKRAGHNWTLLRNLDAFVETGLPVMVGSSRKSFLGLLLAGEDGKPRTELGRDDASAATATLAALAGVWCVRVHDTPRSVDAVMVAARFGAEAVRHGG